MSKTAVAWLVAYTTGLVVSFHDPFYGVLTYLLDYYLHPPLQWWGKGLPDFRWSFLAALVLLLAYLLRRGSLFNHAILRHAQTGWLLGFLAVAAFVTPFAVSRERSLHYLLDLAKLTLLYFLIVGSVRTPKQFRWFVIAMIVGALVWGVEALLDPKRKAGRLEGVGGPDSDTDNALASHLLTVLPFIGIVFLRGRWWERALCLVTAPLVLNTVILANSRGAMAALAVSGIAALVLTRGRLRLQLLGVALMAGLLFWSLTDQTFVSRQLTLLEYEEDGSATGRVEAWKGALRLMKDHPLGTGGGGFDVLSPVYIPEVVEAHGGEERSVHNTYLWVGSDWGIPGLTCFLGFIASTLIQLHRIRQRTADHLIYLQSFAVEVALIGFLTSAFFINRPYAEILYWLSALAATLGNVEARQWETADSTVVAEEGFTGEKAEPALRGLRGS